MSLLDTREPLVIPLFKFHRRQLFMEFHKRRRQQFLTESAYVATTTFFNDVAAPTYQNSVSRPDFDAEDRARVAGAYADETFGNFMLRYTAGESMEVLRKDLGDVIAAYEQAAAYIRAYQKNPAFPPLRFIEIDEYERVLQMIGLCFLLHRRELLPRIAALFDPALADKDTLYEDLLSFDLEGRYELDRWYHDEPYRDLINTMYRDTDEESLEDFQRYLKNWYKALAKAPWHDSHLNIEDDTCAGYFGYWAIEAAALVYLMEFDDSTFREHLVYPKTWWTLQERWMQPWRRPLLATTCSACASKVGSPVHGPAIGAPRHSKTADVYSEQAISCLYSRPLHTVPRSGSGVTSNNTRTASFQATGRAT